jgi:hypothetical protein
MKKDTVQNGGKVEAIGDEAIYREAGCPMWKQFVREIMDYKADLIGFLQTAAGWSVSGDTSD